MTTFQPDRRLQPATKMPAIVNTGMAPESCDALAVKLHRNVRRVIPAIIGAITVASVMPLVRGDFESSVGALAILASGVLPLMLWAKKHVPTLPVVPCVALCEVTWYATPLVFGHPTLLNRYSGEIVGAAASCASYLLFMTAGWALVTRTTRQRPLKVWVVDMHTAQGRGRLVGVSLAALVLCALFECTVLFGWLDAWFTSLPVGAVGPINTLATAIECGSLLVLFFQLGRRQLGAVPAAIAVGTLVTICLAKAASMLLSSVTLQIGAVCLALYLGSGRVPLKVLLVAVAALATLNISKAHMRDRYWTAGATSVRVRPEDLPEYFSRWINLSVQELAGKKAPASQTSRMTRVPRLRSRPTSQTLFQRLSNIDMVLYVHSRIVFHGDEILLGKTYTYVPIVLIPRLLWPEKPRTHIGQEELSVHFKRQSRAATYRTYIAWGLLPEAIGNFGIILGPLVLGLCLGALLGIAEQGCRGVPVFSLRAIGVVLLMLFAPTCGANVASVMVSSLAQMCAVVAMSTVPFLTTYTRVARAH